MRLGLYHWFYCVAIIGMAICWYSTYRQMTNKESLDAIKLHQLTTDKAFLTRQRDTLKHERDSSRELADILKKQTKELREELEKEANKAKESRERTIGHSLQIQAWLQTKMMNDAKEAKSRENKLRKELIDLRIEKAMSKHEEAAREKAYRAVIGSALE